MGHDLASVSWKILTIVNAVFAAYLLFYWRFCKCRTGPLYTNGRDHVVCAYCARCGKKIRGIDVYRKSS